VIFRIKERSSNRLRTFAVRRTPEVLECHMVAGGFDYLIKATVALPI
jgi:DNA-binding Lrp family transcriptional regulator